MKVGDARLFPQVNVEPEGATNKNVTWSSSDTSVFTVDEVNGFIEAVGIGSAKLIATAADGSGVKAECTVTVADIIQYRNQEFRDAHPIVEFETEQGLRCFTVFAVVQIENTDDWYDFHTAADENKYNEQVAGIQSRALYDTGITPEYGQQLLTLSTCYRTNKSDRLVVIGVETPYQ